MTEGNRLRPISLALALGVTAGLWMFFVSWINWWSSNAWGGQLVQVMSSVYRGYRASFWGGIVGFIWAFIFSFIGGLIIAGIYNCCCGKCGKTKKVGVE